MHYSYLRITVFFVGIFQIFWINLFIVDQVINNKFILVIHPFKLAGLMAVFTSAHQLSSLTGVTAASSMTLFEVGDDIQVTKLTRMTVTYLGDPSSATCTGSTKMARGGITYNGGSGTYTNGKFDVRQAGRFHRVRVDAVGNWAAAGVNFVMKLAGNR